MPGIGAVGFSCLLEIPIWRSSISRLRCASTRAAKGASICPASAWRISSTVDSMMRWRSSACPSKKSRSSRRLIGRSQPATPIWVGSRKHGRSSSGWRLLPPCCYRRLTRSATRSTASFSYRSAPGGRRGDMSQTRRLAAILAADVAGYSRLMGADEEGTLERLKALRRELVDPKIAEHHGRIVKTTGDGMLVEFASVVDAVRCAVEVQQAMPERNTGVGADSRIELRIGVNLGDVIVEGDDLYGDGVNIAARIEALAAAGGVFVSNTVHDHVRDRLPFVFEDLGEQQVKNIARPVRVYRVRDTAARSPAAPVHPVLALP